MRHLFFKSLLMSGLLISLPLINTVTKVQKAQGNQVISETSEITIKGVSPEDLLNGQDAVRNVIQDIEHDAGRNDSLRNFVLPEISPSDSILKIELGQDDIITSTHFLSLERFQKKQFSIFPGILPENPYLIRLKPRSKELLLPQARNHITYLEEKKPSQNEKCPSAPKQNSVAISIVKEVCALPPTSFSGTSLQSNYSYQRYSGNLVTLDPTLSGVSSEPPNSDSKISLFPNDDSERISVTKSQDLEKISDLKLDMRPNYFVNNPASKDCIKSTKAAKRENFKTLESCYKEILEEAKIEDNLFLQSYASSNLGALSFARGDFLNSLTYYETQLKVAIQNKDALFIGIALSGRGASYAALGAYDKAVEDYSASLQHLNKEDLPHWYAITKRNLGNAYAYQKKYGKAIESQKESLEISLSHQDNIGELQSLINLGYAHTLSAEFERAQSYYEDGLVLAQALGSDFDIGQALLGLGTVNIYLQRYDFSARYLADSIEIFSDLSMPLPRGIALTNLGDVFLRQKKFLSAEKYSRQAVDVWSAIRAGLGNNDGHKISIFETQLAAYKNLQRALIHQSYKVPEALEVAEQGRARAFTELLARSRTQISDSTGSFSLKQIKQVAKEQNATLVAYTLIRDQMVELPHGMSVQRTTELQNSQLFTWVVKPTGEVHFSKQPLSHGEWQQINYLRTVVSSNPKCTQKSNCLNQVTHSTSSDTARGVYVKPFSPLLTNPGEPEFSRSPLHQLHSMLIAPIIDYLPNENNPSEKVVFIPQDRASSPELTREKGDCLW